uniref:Uncharacterized protein n=1 Tax=Mycena chlorophos TaxID=658473 RepID=A0ABQ0LRN2_MYCCL|nr:predicted protein [Mycena chlorophos]
MGSAPSSSHSANSAASPSNSSTPATASLSRSVSRLLVAQAANSLDHAHESRSGAPASFNWALRERRVAYRPREWRRVTYSHGNVLHRLFALHWDAATGNRMVLERDLTFGSRHNRASSTSPTTSLTSASSVGDHGCGFKNAVRIGRVPAPYDRRLSGSRASILDVPYRSHPHAAVSPAVYGGRFPAGQTPVLAVNGPYAVALDLIVPPPVALYVVPTRIRRAIAVPGTASASRVTYRRQRCRRHIWRRVFNTRPRNSTRVGYAWGSGCVCEGAHARLIAGQAFTFDVHGPYAVTPDSLALPFVDFHALSTRIRRPIAVSRTESPPPASGMSSPFEDPWADALVIQNTDSTKHSAPCILYAPAQFYTGRIRIRLGMRLR